MRRFKLSSGKIVKIDPKNLDWFYAKYPNAVPADGGPGPKEDGVDWFGQTWFGRGWRAASTTGEATDLMSQDFSNIDMKTIHEFMDAKKMRQE